MIPIAQTYGSEVTARTVKVVDCEGCQQKYVYLMERTGFGSAVSPLFLDNEGARQRATENARADLQTRLERNCDPVPCPRCGWYQGHMLKKAKAQHWRGMYVVGAVALIVAVPAALVAFLAQGIADRNPDAVAPAVVPTAVTTAGAGVLLGAVLLGVRLRLMARYDPNGEPAAVRIEEGRDRAWTVEEYAAILARAAAAGGPPAPPGRAPGG